jgi:hypothetical protein
MSQAFVTVADYRKADSYLAAASALVESSLAMKLSAPDCANDFQLAATELRRIAKAIKATPTKKRIITAKDQRAAEAEVSAFMLKVRDQFPGEAPSRNEVRRLAADAKIGHRDLVDACYRSEFVLDGKE